MDSPDLISTYHLIHVWSSVALVVLHLNVIGAGYTLHLVIVAVVADNPKYVIIFN